MKTNCLLVAIALFFSATIANSQTTTAFRKNYNVAMFDLPGNIVEGLTANTYVMAGTNMTFIPIYGTISQLNDTGGVTWSNRYSDASIGFQLNDIKKDVANNQYYTCGGSESNAAVFMIVDASGNVVTSTRFKINEADGAWFNRVVKVADGGYVAVGYVTGYDPDGGGAEIDFAPINYTDANGDPQTEVIGSPLIVKLDASGNHVWHRVFRYYVTSNIPANRIYNDASFVDVVEVSDGYVAVGSYDVNNHLSATNSDGDDATPTDAIILKTNTAGAITYHKQIDNPSNSTTQSSKYFGAVNKTGAGDIIAGGSTDDGYELIQKYAGAGGFSNTFSRRFRYSTSMFGTVTDPADVSQIYELTGGDIATMTMYIKPLSFFSNSIHRVNSTATNNVWAKRYDFSLISILPRGGLTSDGGYISMAMTMGGANYDYHVIKTDPTGDTPLSGCPAAAFTPTASAGPSTFADPIYNSWSGTPGPNALTVIRTSIAPTASYVCTKTTCVAPLEATTVTATPATICSGQSANITASGPSAGVSYQVWTASVGGANLGTTSLSVSPASTTTYYIQTVSNSDGTCVSATRVPVTVTVNTVTASNAGTNQSVCGTTATLAGNTPAAGTGVWTLVSGSGTITTPSSPTSGVTGLGVGPNVFEWTISNAPCTPSSSQVTITGVAAPTASNAGTNQSICSTSATLAGNTPAVGTGVWTLVSGSGTITTPSSPTSGVTGLGVGPNVFEWTITNAPCPPSSTQVTITNTGGPTTSVAGTNQSVCGTTATLAGNTPVTGTGVWTLVSGSGTITTPSSPTSGITGLGVGPNVFEWTISNAPCTPSSSQVTITGVAAPTASNAGTNQSICSTSATLAGNTPTVGVGTWTLVSGSGTITTPSSPTSGVTGLGAGPNVFEWTITNAPCPPSSTQVTITNTGGPTTSVAGTNQSVCGTTATLAGNTPVTGTGVWTLVSGSGTITTPSSPTSGITGLGVGPNVFEWTISNAPCAPSSSQVTITGVAAPTASNAGTNQSICSTSATLAGNTPAVGTGVWTLVSGSGTITDSTNSNTTVTGLGAGPNVFEWTITNAPCPPSSTQVTITNTGGPTTSVAGTNQSVCGTTATLAGNTPVTGTGVWTLVSGSGTITTPSSPTSGITGLGVGPNVFEWTISNAPCAPSSSQVTITGVAAPTVSNAGTNQTICSSTDTLAGNTPAVGTGTWTLISGSGSITDPTNPNTTVTGLGIGANVFEWTISNAPCTPSSSQVTITVSGGPTVNANATDTIICMGDTITLTGSGNAVSYSWNNGVSDGISFVPSVTQTYTVTGVDANNCSTQDQISVVVNAVPSVVVSGNNNICQGDTATLTASGATSYVWSTTDTTTSIQVNPIGTTIYTVIGTNSNGCKNTTQYTVTVSPPPTAAISGTTDICFGQTVTLTASGGATYTWSTGQTTTSISDSPNDTFSYWVIAHVGSCVDSAFYTVNVTPNPTVSINPSTDITIIQGESVDLTASGGTSYTWSPSDGLSCTTCATTTATPEETTKYCVGTIQNGCVDTACITVNVDIVCGELFVPSAFSPNGDGVNDCLSVYNNCIDKMDFKIFARWGEVVFQSINVNDCWDGTYKGTALNTAVFVYKLEATMLNGDVVELKGNVSLIK